MIRVFGALLLLVGVAVMLVSFYADSLGIGAYAGAGKDQFVLTAIGLMIQGSGLLLVLSGKGT